jgi:DNA-binding MarR family transcriptional regulator
LNVPESLTTGIRFNAWNQAAHRALIPVGVTVPQAMVILHLAENEANRMALIAEALHVTPANVTGIVQRLEVVNIIERAHPENNRKTLAVKLTTKGAALVSQIKAALNGVQIEAA